MGEQYIIEMAYVHAFPITYGYPSVGYSDIVLCSQPKTVKSHSRISLLEQKTMKHTRLREVNDDVRC
jgi:hypothetical protein